MVGQEWVHCTHLKGECVIYIPVTLTARQQCAMSLDELLLETRLCKVKDLEAKKEILGDLI